MKSVKRLQSVEDFEALRLRPLGVVFKHSTTYPLSARARAELLTLVESHPEVEIHEVQVIEDRDLSEHIARSTGVPHESPQILVLRTGAVAWHDSHFGVTARAVASAIA
jgi:bacillithiol system protein YtxJ